ncbi:MAG: hydantoinase/carbamoylase family amidase [Thermomicrobiales bacterium]
MSQTSGTTYTVNQRRLLGRLATMAAIGATDGGGVTRLALSDEDKQARDLLATWMSEAGLEVRIDDVGNMTGHRPGRRDLPPVLIGSHLDTIVKGGRFDGVLGVLAALEVVETLNDHQVTTELPIAIVNWTNEEGVRFEPAMTCAGVAAGRFTVEEIHDKVDRAGLRFGDELRRIGYFGNERNRPLPASAYLELHIEQGPVLEAADAPVGIVGGIVGITWSEVTITGQADHAGPSPMHLRHDALPRRPTSSPASNGSRSIRMKLPSPRSVASRSARTSSIPSRALPCSASISGTAILPSSKGNTSAWWNSWIGSARSGASMAK